MPFNVCSACGDPRQTKCLSVSVLFVGILDRQNTFQCLSVLLVGILGRRNTFQCLSVLHVGILDRRNTFQSLSVLLVGILYRRNTFQHWVDYCGYSDVLDLDGSLKFPFNASHTAAKLPILQPVRVHLHYDKYGLWSPMFVYFTYIKTCREITIATDLCTT